MSDEGGLPEVGTKLVANRRKPVPALVEGVIVSAPETLGDRSLIVDGERFQSLSAAANRITGNPCNGWIWWKNADGSPLKRGS
jgi:hypothetical protein